MYGQSVYDNSDRKVTFRNLTMGALFDVYPPSRVIKKKTLKVMTS